MSRALHVPVTLPLSLGAWLGAGSAPPARFPFDGSRATLYFLARNAIWHGADALGLKAGDEVLMPSYHHGVEPECLLAKGMKLRFYRVDERMVADLEDVRAKLRPDTRALYVTHYLGIPQPIGAFREIASGAGIPLIEDCALSLYSRTEAGPLGSFGDIGIFCLYKSLPVPHGGALALNRKDLAMPPVPRPPDRVTTTSYILNRLLDAGVVSRSAVRRAASETFRSLARAAKHAARTTVVPIDTEEFDVLIIDLGVRDVARRIIRHTNADETVARRRANFLRFAERLDPGVRAVFPSLPPGACPLSFPIFVKEKVAVAERLMAAGVESVNMWARHHPASPRGSFPEIDFLREHVLELPCHQGLRFDHVDYAAEKASELARW